MSQHNNSKRELNGNRCHILNWKYFHSWDKDTVSSSRVICPLPSPHTDTYKHALKIAYTISKSIVGLFWKTFLRFLWEGETLLPLHVQARLPGISHFAVASCCWWTENRRKIKRSKCQQGSAVHSAPLHLLSGHLEQRVIPRQSCPRLKVGVEVETLHRMQACGIVTKSSRISLWSISTCRGRATFYLDSFTGYCVFLGRNDEGPTVT